MPIAVHRAKSSRRACGLKRQARGVRRRRRGP